MPDVSTQSNRVTACLSHAGCGPSRPDMIISKYVGEHYPLPAKSWNSQAAARALKSDIDRDKGNLTLRLKELCATFQVSEREMRRAFKRLFQIAPREYQCRVR